MNWAPEADVLGHPEVRAAIESALADFAAWKQTFASVNTEDRAEMPAGATSGVVPAVRTRDEI